MSIEIDNSRYLPLEIATKYYGKWDCDTTCKIYDGVYYKCLNGIGNVQYLNGNQYRGTFQNGLMHGKGVYSWKNGLKYEGQFSNNHVSGKGTLTWPNGSFYKGYVTDGKRNGWGEYVSTIDRSSYLGNWKNGEKEGQGMLTFSNGSVYEGHFVQGVREGQGKMRYLSGNWYEGSWKKDKKVGWGTMNWVGSNEKYEGEWNNDKPEGMGSYFWFQGKVQTKTVKTIYRGQWREGKRCGYGVFYYNGGCRLQGSFKDNMKQGLFYVEDEFGQGHIEVFTNDKSILKRDELQQKKDLQHFKLPDIKEGTINNYEPAQNNYNRCIAIDHICIDQTIYNLLLRENSHLRQWYKTISGSLNKELFGGFSIEGIWRLVKDLKLNDEFITLAKLNRQFYKGKKANFKVVLPNSKKLQLIKHHSQLLNNNYTCFEWDVLFHSIQQTDLQWEAWPTSQTMTIVESIGLTEKLNPHHSDHTVLFRHFVEFILHIALLQHQQKAEQPNNPTFRKYLEDLLYSIKTVVNPVPSLRSDKITSEVFTNVSHTQSKMAIAEEYLAITHELFECFTIEQEQMLEKIDKTVSVRQLYVMLCACGYFKEVHEKMFFLQKIERNMSHRTGLLKKENKVHFGQFQKVVLNSSHFSHILNYALIEHQFTQILHIFLNRKIGNTQSKEDFLKKYQQMVTQMIITLKTGRETEKGKKRVAFRWQRVSSKDRLRHKLEQKMQQQRLKLEEERRKQIQLQREFKERLLMGKEDRDIKNEDQISDQEESYYD